MMKSESFLQELHRTYERIKVGHSGRTDLYEVDYLVDTSRKVAGVTLESELKKISRAK